MCACSGHTHTSKCPWRIDTAAKSHCRRWPLPSRLGLAAQTFHGLQHKADLAHHPYTRSQRDGAGSPASNTIWTCQHYRSHSLLVKNTQYVLYGTISQSTFHLAHTPLSITVLLFSKSSQWASHGPRYVDCSSLFSIILTLSSQSHKILLTNEIVGVS